MYSVEPAYEFSGEDIIKWMQSNIVSSPLIDYIKILDYRSEVPDNLRVSRKGFATWITYVLDMYLEVIKSFVKVIRFIHGNDNWLASLTNENIRIVDGILKLWRLEFIQWSPLDHKRDYESVWRILKFLFSHFALSCRIPLDVKSLLFFHPQR